MRAALLLLWLGSGCSAFDESLLRRILASETPDAGSLDGGSAGGGGTADSGAPHEVPPPPRDAATPHEGGVQTSDAAAEAPGELDADASQDEDEDGGSPPPPACVPSEIDDYCAQLPELPLPAVIDGELDCGPPLLPIAAVAWNGVSPVPAGHATSIAAAWRADGLYVYVRVNDDTVEPHPEGQSIWCGDAVELYVDADGVAAANGNYDAPGTMQFIVAAPSAAAPDAARFVQGAAQGTWSTSALQVVALGDGYAVETFITAADLGLASWSPQTQIGLDLAIGVSGASSDPNIRCGVQIGQYFMRVGTAPSSCSGEPWCDTRAFCTPQL